MIWILFMTTIIELLKSVWEKITQTDYGMMANQIINMLA